MWPGAGRQLGRPLVKGNNPVQQANRPFPGGRRDLISDHKAGWGQGDSVLPRAEGGAQTREVPHTICSRHNGTTLQVEGNEVGLVERLGRLHKTGGDWPVLPGTPGSSPAVPTPPHASAEAASRLEGPSPGARAARPYWAVSSLALHPLSSGGAVACTTGTERRELPTLQGTGEASKVGYTAACVCCLTEFCSPNLFPPSWGLLSFSEAWPLLRTY